MGHENLRMMSEIIEVPLPRAASRRLISFLTFHISIWSIAQRQQLSSILRSVGQRARARTRAGGGAPDVRSSRPRSPAVGHSCWAGWSLCGDRAKTTTVLVHERKDQTTMGRLA